MRKMQRVCPGPRQQIILSLYRDGSLVIPAVVVGVFLSLCTRRDPQTAQLSGVMVRGPVGRLPTCKPESVHDFSASEKCVH
jgi:hypothetical protein